MQFTKISVCESIVKIPADFNPSSIFINYFSNSPFKFIQLRWKTGRIWVFGLSKKVFSTQIFWCTYDFCTAHLLCILADSAITYRLNSIKLKLLAVKNKQDHSRTRVMYKGRETILSFIIYQSSIS